MTSVSHSFKMCSRRRIDWYQTHKQKRHRAKTTLLIFNPKFLLRFLTKRRLISGFLLVHQGDSIDNQNHRYSCKINFLCAGTLLFKNRFFKFRPNGVYKNVHRGRGVKVCTRHRRRGPQIHLRVCPLTLYLLRLPTDNHHYGVFTFFQTWNAAAVLASPFRPQSYLRRFVRPYYPSVPRGELFRFIYFFPKKLSERDRKICDWSESAANWREDKADRSGISACAVRWSLRCRIRCRVRFWAVWARAPARTTSALCSCWTTRTRSSANSR